MTSFLDPIRDAADGVERRARSVLLGQDRIRLAVTGLSRAGKTVALTSVIANLLAAGRGARTLPALDIAAGGRLRAARLVPPDAEALPRFDVAHHLASLAADPPAWPERTADLATLALTLDIDRAGAWNAVLGGRTVTLELLDYPGEWLLDLPMLEQDYADWSAESLTRLRDPAHRSATQPFLDFIDALPPAAPAEDALARRGFDLYRAALLDCRDRLHLRFLQPGRALNPGPRGEAPILWFFPLPATTSGGLATLLARRHAAYRADVRSQFFDPFFRRFDRQAVLVDVLGALHAGAAAFADTAAALHAIAAALANQGSALDRWLGQGPVRTAFVATKADHVPARARQALATLLGTLTGADGEAAATHAIAAIRCTEDDVLQLGNRTVAAVRGVLLDTGRSAKVFPGEVPLTPPGADYWSHGLFEMPAFRPPRLDGEGRSGIPHVGLDTLLAWLIGDLL